MARRFLYLLCIFLFLAYTSCRKTGIPNPPDPGGPDTTHVPEPPDTTPVEIVETEPAVLTAINTQVAPDIPGFYTAVPARYSETAEQGKRYPLLVFFHGGGQYGNGGNELDTVMGIGIAKLLKDKVFPPSFTVGEEKHSFIVVVPQFKRTLTQAETSTQMDALMAHIDSAYRIDTSRIYLSGFSLGARMALYYAVHAPNKIAAVTAMGGEPPTDENINVRTKILSDAQLPLWLFHNRDDMAWPYSTAVEFINSFNAQSPVIPPLFTTFDVGEGKSQHDCWTRTSDTTYRENGKNIYEWMLGYTR